MMIIIIIKLPVVVHMFNIYYLLVYGCHYIGIFCCFFFVDSGVQQLGQTQRHFHVLLTLQQLNQWLTVTLPPIDIPELHCYLCHV